jgi:hypothetical protein
VRSVLGALTALPPAGGEQEARRLRIIDSAADLHYRAAAAFRNGDPATALDLGSHAAGLLAAISAESAAGR